MCRAIKERVLAGKAITGAEAQSLWQEDLEDLIEAAQEIERKFCRNKFSLCAIVNAKSGGCPEDCHFCAQAQIYGKGRINEYPLLPLETILAAAKNCEKQGISRFSLVTAGRKISATEVATLCRYYRCLQKNTSLSLCGSLGLLGEEDFKQLKEAGLSRYHHNLETSRDFFPQICTTHTYQQKLDTIKAAQKAGLNLCCGGIFGLGETREDRLSLAFTFRELKINSLPINILNPIPDTPLAQQPPLPSREIHRTIALYRFILPGADLRLAGGRNLLNEAGRFLFRRGINAAISGDMLTTAGANIGQDIERVKALGYETTEA